MKIVLLGSGNVATVLGRLFCKAHHTVTQVFSRSAESSQILAAELTSVSGNPVAFTNNIQDLDQGADLYLLCVSDNALQKAASWLKLGDQLVAHTAGGVSKKVLSNVSANYGVLYPLQSLRKEMSRVPEIPFLVDGNTSRSLTTLSDLAFQISPHVQQADDEIRLKLHIGAIIVNNFTNHLFTLAADYCERESIDFSLLMPLIREGAERLQFASPGALQTGPAVREDTATIQDHERLLASHPRLLAIYTTLTSSIRQYYHQQNKK